MEKKTDIHAVELIRRIRDEQAEMLRGKSDEEIIEFFRRAGRAFRNAARTKRPAASNQRIQLTARKASRG